MDAAQLTYHSFSSLYRDFEQKLLMVAVGIVRDRAVAQDIVNDSFAELWERRDRVSFTNIEAYLFQMVRNNCLNHRRRAQIGHSVYEKIRSKEQGMMDYFTRSIEACDPNSLFYSEIENIYRAELEQMSELTQRIFTAHKIEGRSYREIAEIMNVDTKKVDNELRKSTARLRRSLKDYLPVLAAFFTI